MCTVHIPSGSCYAKFVRSLAPNSFKNSSKLLSFTDTENNQFMPYKFRWFAGWMTGWLALYLVVFPVAQRGLFCVAISVFIILSGSSSHTFNDNHSPYMNAKHFWVEPKSYPSLQDWFIPSFLYLNNFFFFTSFNFGTGARSNVHFVHFFFLLLSHFTVLPDRSFALSLHPLCVIRCLLWVHLQNAISLKKKKTKYRSESIVKGLISFV